MPHDSVLILQNCNQLIQTIEDTGTILREIRDLEEQVTLWQSLVRSEEPRPSSTSRVLSSSGTVQTRILRFWTSGDGNLPGVV